MKVKRKLGVIFVLCFLFLTSAALANSNPHPPGNPSPANGAVIENRDVTISWQCAGDPDGDSVVYDVFFGTTDPPPFSHTQAGISYDAGTLEFKTYYWRIVVKDDKGGVTIGPVWSFTVIQKIQVSIDVTKISIDVYKPGWYTSSYSSITVTSEGNVKLCFGSVGNPAGLGGEIETWYKLDGCSWKEASGLAGHEHTFVNPVSDQILNLGIKFHVKQSTPPSTYDNKFGLTFYPEI